MVRQNGVSNLPRYRYRIVTCFLKGNPLDLLFFCRLHDFFPSKTKALGRFVTPDALSGVLFDHKLKGHDYGLVECTYVLCRQQIKTK